MKVFCIDIGEVGVIYTRIGYGRKNAGLLAASIIALSDEKIRKNLEAFRKKQTEAVLATRVPK